MPAGGASRWGASRWCQQVVLEQCESLVQCEEGGRTAVPGYSESTSSVIPIETSERPRTEPDERAEPTRLLSAAVPAASANMRCHEVSASKIIDDPAPAAMHLTKRVPTPWARLLITYLLASSPG